MSEAGRFAERIVLRSRRTPTPGTNSRFTPGKQHHETLISDRSQLALFFLSRWLSGLILFLSFLFGPVLLIHPSLGNSDRQRPHSSNHANPLRHGNRAARVQNIEVVRALQAQIVSTEQRKALLLFRDRMTCFFFQLRSYFFYLL